jgi:aminoglycoside phosphotransferase (APT) family kinase protein
MHALTLDARAPMTVVHTDVHSGNWFTERDGSMGLLDCAAVARGQGARDLAYALTSALTVENRRAWEHDLVEQYTARLSEVSGTPHDAAEIFLAYRQQTLHGLGYWVYTLGHGALQPHMQPDAVSLINIERMATAVLDLDTFGALDPA